MINGFALDLLATAARGLPILEPRPPALMGRGIALHVLADDLAMHEISGFLGGRAEKALGWRFAGVSSVIVLKFSRTDRSYTHGILRIFKSPDLIPSLALPKCLRDEWPLPGRHAFPKSPERASGSWDR